MYITQWVCNGHFQYIISTHVQEYITVYIICTLELSALYGLKVINTFAVNCSCAITLHNVFVQSIKSVGQSLFAYIPYSGKI